MPGNCRKQTLLRAVLLRACVVLCLSVLVYWIGLWPLKLAFVLGVVTWGMCDRELREVRHQWWHYLRHRDWDWSPSDERPQHDVDS